MVPPGAGLVAAPPPGPAQVEGETGAGDEPGGVLAGEADQAGGLCDSEPDGADAGGGQGCPGRRGTGASPRGMPGPALLACCFCWPPVLIAFSGAGHPGLRAGAGTAGGGGRVMSPHSALRMAVSRSWASAARAVCREIASQVRAWHWSQPSVSFPVLNVCSRAICGLRW